MVGRRYDNGPAWQIVHLKEERADDTFNLARLMNVTPLLSDNVELVEEKHTRRRAREVEDATEPACRLTEEAADYRLVADCQEGNAQSLSDRFR